MTTNAYQKYIRSKEWQELKLDLIAARGVKCERCDKAFTNPSKLQVHHLTYDRLFNEVASDLQLLCRHCHKVVHGLAKDKLTQKEKIMLSKKANMKRKFRAIDIKYGKLWKRK